MFCKHFIKIFVGVSSFNMWLRALEAVRSGGAHSIFLIENMKSATAFCPDRLCFSDSVSCYLSLWNAVAVHIFYSEHTVYFPDPLCCARSMAELFFNSKALLMGELLELHVYLELHFYIRKLFYQLFHYFWASYASRHAFAS